MKLLVTGAAGFIGFHLSLRLTNEGHEVVGLDNLDPYYDVNLKKARLDILSQSELFRHVNISLQDERSMSDLFKTEKFTHVINLAAQAGVRYSIENPMAYVNTNLVGFANVLEGCRHNEVEHLVYASSSSVYGMNTKMPLSPHEGVDHPMSLYAATKKSNEMMAHSYSNLYDLPTTGLRFFTVYGPWGRPDMALFLFTKNILEEKPINVFNYGKMRRDFTYIDDIVEGVVRVTKNIATANPDWDGDNPDPCTSSNPYRVYNIGNNQVVELSRYIEVIEEVVGKKAIYNYMPMQPGDVPATEADVSDLMQDVGFKPDTSIEFGIRKFIEWYREYYNA
ncbi:NAD-dependent epimerase/dehydratase family protein [Pseudodesulfovibrio cashew]|uniref:NAD-dependent epimerase/dehydratase family protein n=1 Tax=Pseudodesulfovibrio cashew TaxID=2678688 RepID=A0A6I6JPG2_9BACT|nr:NAD-dependent epimerase [Pseudodesulfovibrio cashew]QGY39514.1 NAD-dependent epimerase/dehydratase family protein [Pseudodesulfovibrio cashew]